MFVYIRIALLSRAAMFVTVLVIELRLILDKVADPSGSGSFTPLDPKTLLLGIACYLALRSKRILPTLQTGKDTHSV